MKRYLCSYIVPLLVLLTACTQPEKATESPTIVYAVTLDRSVNIIGGKTVYVPIYSQIYVWDRNRTMELTSTLSVRNTDLTHPIIINSVQYYDNNGKLIRSHLVQPIQLPPLAAIEFIVNQDDTTGGAGASFIVEWLTQKQVSEPVIEAVMINASGNQGVSLVSPGRVIKTRTNSK